MLEFIVGIVLFYFVMTSMLWHVAMMLDMGKGKCISMEQYELEEDNAELKLEVAQLKRDLDKMWAETIWDMEAL